MPMYPGTINSDFALDDFERRLQHLGISPPDGPSDADQNLLSLNHLDPSLESHNHPPSSELHTHPPFRIRDFCTAPDDIHRKDLPYPEMDGSYSFEGYKQTERFP